MSASSWIADKIEHWPIDKLIPYARNARIHSDEQIAQIAASIAEFGFVNPILTGADGVLVAGHGRLIAPILQRLCSKACRRCFFSSSAHCGSPRGH